MCFLFEKSHTCTQPNLSKLFGCKYRNAIKFLFSIIPQSKQIDAEANSLIYERFNKEVPALAINIQCEVLAVCQKLILISI